MNRLFALFGLSFAFFAGVAGAVDHTGATAGTWTYDVPAARLLAEDSGRPLVVMFSNSSGKCAWCNKFEAEINSSQEWKIYATEQQLAMAYINYDGPNWDEKYYLNVCSNNSEITGFPAFVFYASDGSNVLDSFSFNSTDVTYNASTFIAQVDEVLESADSKLDDFDIWDPEDDTVAGATELDFQSYNLRQGHTLNKVTGTGSADTDDWFKFLCVKGRKYMLQIPAYDYTIKFTAHVTNGTSGTLLNTNLPTGFGTNTVIYPASTNWVTLGTVTNVLGSFEMPFLYPQGTNFLIQVVTNAVVALTNLPPLAVSTNYSETFSTNLPSASIQASTNGTPPDVIVPTVSFFDATGQTPVTVDAGPLGATNTLLLTSLTNGCVFTPPDSFANAYCTFRVNQELTNTSYALGGEVVQPPVTNLNIRIAYTNTTTTSTSRATVSNVWLLITMSPPNGLGLMLVTTNLVSEGRALTVTNSADRTQTYSATNAVVTVATNYVTYTYDNTTYGLSYRLWEPGEIVFSSTNVSVSEAAASVKLTVTRKGGSTGSAKVSYRFEDDTAQDGQDYKAVAGELFWADGQTGSTNLTVELIQDLRPAWEGDERFFATLTKHTRAPWFQAAIGSASNAVVTLKESAAKSAGKLTFSGSDDDNTPFPSPSKPALTVTEGDSFTLWVSRAGGSNGTASVTVSTANGSASADTDFVAYSETLTWEDQDCEPKPVTLETLSRDAYNRDAAFSVKLSAAAGAALGSPTAVTVTVRDEAVAYSLADTAAAAAAVGASFKATSPLWFWSDEAKTTLRCEPLEQKGKKAVLQLTLTGPGLLSFNWGMSDWQSPDTLTCAGGVVLSKTLAAASGTSSVLVKAGKQTVTWTYTKASAVGAEAYASLNALFWQPLPKATTPEPANGARVYPEELAWFPAPGSSVTLGGDFGVGADGLAVTRTAVAVSPKGLSLSNLTDSATFDALWGGASPAFNTSYKWRVDTVFAHPDGTLVNTGDAWAFKAIDASDDTALPPEGANEAGVYEALQGVSCDFGDISAEADGLTYALAGGSLPTGLKLTAATGKISGLPTKAGTWTVTLQATATEEGARAPLNTATFTVTVYPLGAFEGTYTGWTTSDRDGLPYSGSGSFTLSASSGLSAKFTVDGATVSFSKKGLDATDDPAAPSSVENVLCYGASVTASDGKHTNTLESLSIDTQGSLTAVLTLYTLTANSDGTKTATPATHQVELFKNSWADSGMKALLSAFTGYYTVSLPVAETADEATAPLGSGYLTMTVGANGSVKLGGVLADGNPLSLSTPLLILDPSDTNGTETAGKTAHVYVYAAPASYAGHGGFCGLLRLTAGESLPDNSVDSSDERGPLQWWNFTPTSVYGATGTAVTATSGFRNWVSGSGGFYDTVMNLQTYYLNKTLTFKDSVMESGSGAGAPERLPQDYDGRDGTSGYEILSSEESLLPFGTALVIGAQAISAVAKRVVTNDNDQATTSLIDCIDFSDSQNVSGLTLSLARATGLLAGSFNLVYEKEDDEGAFTRKTRAVSIKGVHTPTRPRDSEEEPSAGRQGAGFYLIPETRATTDGAGKKFSYSFNGSFAFELFSEE